MANPKELTFPNGEGHRSSGIQIMYIKSRDVLNISGFYDDWVGIDSTEISFKDFCDKLGIDLRKTR